MGDGKLASRLIGGVRAAAEGGGSRARLRGDMLEWLRTADPASAVSHPLGFMHFELAAAEGTALRLHIWDSARPPGKPDTHMVHDHIWDMTSLVLAGELHNVIVAAEPGGAEPTRRIITVSYVDGCNLMEPQDEVVTPAEKSRTRYVAGRAYKMEPGVFHDTDVPDGLFTATLVVAVKGMRSEPRVLGPLDYGTVLKARDRAPAADASGALARLGSALRSNGVWDTDASEDAAAVSDPSGRPSTSRSQVRSGIQGRTARR